LKTQPKQLLGFLPLALQFQVRLGGKQYDGVDLQMLNL